jgi:hypothetical protein
MRRALLLLGTVVLLTAGCQTGLDQPNVEQWRIASGAGSPSNIASLASVLKRVANATGMTDYRPSSPYPDSLAFYSTRTPQSGGVEVYAHPLGNDLLIAVSGPSGKPSSEFKRIKRVLSHNLHQEFGSRCVVYYIPVPVSGRS